MDVPSTRTNASSVRLQPCEPETSTLCTAMTNSGATTSGRIKVRQSPARRSAAGVRWRSRGPAAIVRDQVDEGGPRIEMDRVAVREVGALELRYKLGTDRRLDPVF